MRNKVRSKKQKHPGCSARMCNFVVTVKLFFTGTNHPAPSLAGKAGLEPATYGLENRSSIR